MYVVTEISSQILNAGAWFKNKHFISFIHPLEQCVSTSASPESGISAWSCLDKSVACTRNKIAVNRGGW